MSANNKYSKFYQILGAIYWRFREKTDPWIGKLRRKSLKNYNITIISNNCWGGHFYRYYGLPYDSPTIGLYFYMDDYIKFVSNLLHYLDVDIKFINYTESKYSKQLVQRGEINVPIGLLDDVEIIFLHYHSIEEAREKWNRRKQRIHRDNIWLKVSEMNGCTKEHLDAFAALPTNKKILLAAHPYDYDCCVFRKDWASIGYIKDDTSLFNMGLNLSRTINMEKVC